MNDMNQLEAEAAAAREALMNVTPTWGGDRHSSAIDRVARAEAALAAAKQTSAAASTVNGALEISEPTPMPAPPPEREVRYTATERLHAHRAAIERAFTLGAQHGIEPARVLSVVAAMDGALQRREARRFADTEAQEQYQAEQGREWLRRHNGDATLAQERAEHGAAFWRAVGLADAAKELHLGDHVDLLEDGARAWEARSRATGA